ncbi:glycosyltransferase [Pantanalinema rosaneae CENA516]|uniref:glycosyltransferase n=1 Tax=Pantanalinema rosaneae TaxID=1620701 RepID=UPI003D6FD81D
MKVALIHDYLREYGDAERVLQGLHHLYPQAPVYTAFIDYQELGEQVDRLSGWDIRPTIAQQLPGMTQHFHAYRLGLPYFWESLNLSEYDLVISCSSNYLSHAVLTHSHTLHLSYCLTPPRYLWEPIPITPYPNHWYTRWLDTRLRQYDFYAAQRVDRFITNSEMAARRIRKFYRRQVEVIAPPVPIQGYGEAGNQYYLYIGDLSTKQQVDLAVSACSRLNRPLWVVGAGAEAERLRQIASPCVRFLGKVPSAHLSELYDGAIAVIHPSAYEDFGYIPIEAMGRGIPVIASEQSGMKEIILNFRTGLLFPQPTVESLCAAIEQFEKLRFSAQACIERAEEFAESVFAAKLAWFIAKALDDHQHGTQAGTSES